EHGKAGGKPKPRKNNLKKLRLEKMMSKAELARRAGVSTLTIDRVERGLSCRMDTKRKILEALGLKPSDRVTVFGEDEEGGGRGFASPGGEGGGRRGKKGSGV